MHSLAITPTILLHVPGQVDPIALGLGLAAVGVVLLLIWYDNVRAAVPTGARRGAARSEPGRLPKLRLWTAVATIVVGAGIAGWGAFAPSGPQDPIPATAESLQQGHDLYQAYCAECHGVSGRGDGPSAALFNPPPADLRVHMAHGHTDGQLYDWIMNGMGATGMPAYRNQLSDDDVWNVINYIRTFAG